MLVMGVDPGKTTGIVFHRVGTDDWERRELGPDLHHMALWDLLWNWMPDVICLEEFIYQIRQRDNVQMPGVDLTAKEYIGVVKLYVQAQSRTGEVKLVLRKAADVKPLWTDKKLKALGLYETAEGRQHMNDAVRHVLHHLVVDLKMKGYVSSLR
jgi:hypothetical protein